MELLTSFFYQLTYRLGRSLEGKTKMDILKLTWSCLFVYFLFICSLLLLPISNKIDYLILFNFFLSCFILIWVIFSKNPHYRIFPSFVFLLLLYQVAICLLSTKQILLDPNVGKIVSFFGNFFVGGDFFEVMIGAALFLILTLMNFIMIAKGKDTVHVMLSRFIPGSKEKQDLERDFPFYQALNRIGKLLLWNVTLLILLTAIIMVGGWFMGTRWKLMSSRCALEMYSILSIGHSLVFQIPISLLFIANGIMTWKKTKKNLPVFTVET